MTISQFLAEDSLPPDLTGEQRELLSCWDALAPEKRKALLALIKVLC